MNESPREPTIREAEEADVGPLAELWALSFPGERTVAERVDALRSGGPFGGLETCRIAESGGRVAGAFRLYELTLHLFGRAIPTLGVAAVAVAPEFRRRGLGAAMCRAALRIGRERGDLFSALYPFRVDFYARMGYALAGSFHRYRFPPASLPLFDGWDRVVRLPRDERGARLAALHEALLPRSHGMAARSGKGWVFLDAEDVIAVGVPASDDGVGLSGYMIVESGPDRSGAGAALRVRELLAAEPDAYRALLGWISAQRDQWRTVTYDALPGERLEQVLTHPRLPGSGRSRGLWFSAATILRGPMVRILDVPALLERLGWEAGSALGIHDPELPENSGRWTMTEDGSRRTADEPAPNALTVGVASGLLAEGALPGIPPRPRGFDPALGIADFRLLDAF